MTAGGYFGRALVVDASTGASDTMTLADDVLRAYVGGAGLGAWLMHRLAPPRVDPLSAEAPLAYVFSPLVGTGQRGRPDRPDRGPSRGKPPGAAGPGLAGGRDRAGRRARRPVRHDLPRRAARWPTCSP